jgi:hypothetical protein
MILLLFLAACTSSPPNDTSGDIHTDSDTDTHTDSDTEETGQDTDDGCILHTTLGETSILGGETVPFERAPALSHPRHLTLHLENACAQAIRFLGHPDDWVAGTGFQMEDLPPVLLEPGESTDLTLRFQPGEEGIYSGAFTLPYDRPSSPFAIELTAEVAPPLTMVLVGDGLFATTTDYGQTFTEVRLTSTAHSNELRRGVCWGLGQFIATGGSDQRNLWASPDGLTWTSIQQGSGWVADCASNGTQVVAAGGSHTLADTADLDNWTLNNHNGSHFRTVAYGNGHYVAVGDSDSAASTDGQTWLHTTEMPAESNRDIAFGNGAFVAVANEGWVSTSIDNGQTWVSTQLSTSGFSTVVFGNDTFYAGDGDSVFRSSEGLAWERVNASGGVVPRGVVGSTLFGTGNGTFYRSTDDAFSWESLYTFANGSGFNDATFAGEE